MRPLEGVGIYEKALAGSTWRGRLGEAVGAGYDFIELAVDDAPERAERLAWSASERESLVREAERAGTRVGTIVLSLHRAVPLGSGDPEIRARAREVGAAAIELAVSLGAPLVQVAGYATYAEPQHADARSCFLDGLAGMTKLAEAEGVVLALENVDGQDVVTAHDGIRYVEEVASDAFRLYVDVGNFAGQGLAPAFELGVALPFAAAVQLKDARRDTYRRVPFGTGEVPWQAVFAQLKTYTGPLSIEMWNDAADPTMAAEAREWLTRATACVSPCARRPSRGCVTRRRCPDALSDSDGRSGADVLGEVLPRERRS